MTIANVAETIQMSEAAVRKFVLEKTIPHFKIGGAVRFLPSEIEGWIEERKRAIKAKGTNGGRG
jgi:excisionase family DNA binding protein